MSCSLALNGGTFRIPSTQSKVSNSTRGEFGFLPCMFTNVICVEEAKQNSHFSNKLYNNEIDCIRYHLDLTESMTTNSHY